MNRAKGNGKAQHPQVPGAADEAVTRAVPWSPEAEQSLLGALLLDNSSLGRVSDLVDIDSFFARDHKLIFGAVAGQVAERKLADVITVYERLQAVGQAGDVGGLAYLNALAQGVTSANGARRYAEIVADRAMLRSVISACDEVATTAFNPRGKTAGQVIDVLADRIRRVDQQRKAPSAKRVPLMHLVELRDSAAQVRWLVKHAVPAESVGMLFGGSGSFKSFIALDLALHIAHGLPWLGRRSTKGPVIYIAAEGGAGLWARIEAWHRARGLRWEDAELYVVPVAVNLGADAWRVVDAAQLAGVVPALVIADTLSQTYSGEENSAAEISAYLRELGARFRALWRCCVMVVHHSGHLATDRPRGSSAIHANLDFLLSVFRDEKELIATVSCLKQKDGDPFRDAMFSLTPMTLGIDSDGDSITSLVARHLSNTDEVDEAVAGEAKAGRGGRGSLMMSLAQNGQPLTTLRKLFYDELPPTMDAEAKKKAFQRAKAFALTRQQFEVVEGFILFPSKRDT